MRLRLAVLYGANLVAITCVAINTPALLYPQKLYNIYNVYKVNTCVMGEGKQFISVAEAAQLIGVSSQTLRNWEKRGELVPYRNPINKYRLYELEQIEDFLNQMRLERNRKSKFKIKIVSIKD